MGKQPSKALGAIKLKQKYRLHIDDYTDGLKAMVSNYINDYKKFDQKTEVEEHLSEDAK